MAMNFIGCAAHCSRRARSAIAGSIVGAAMLAAPAAFACALADAASSGRYVSAAAKPMASLQLNRDGSFHLLGVPAPGADFSGCWQRSGDTVALVEGLAIGGEGIKRALPEPLTQADLDKVRGNGIDTLQQAVDAGLLPLGRVWANQPRRAGETVRVSVYEPRVGLAVGEAKAMLRLADGQVIEQSPVPGDDGQFEFASLPKRAVVKAIGVRFPERPDRIRWLSVEDSTKLLYLIEFDARALGAAEGGGMTLTRQADGGLISDFPDAPHFKRLP
ncbi:hypothetical protein [Lysobacter capsici]|uniref:hypothetical protein n=1 Tax=Lysobacter capsici TaxID=435897 RepID=UPI0012FDAF98|nr:hypothetical protein [Lysobacter capsici]